MRAEVVKLVDGGLKPPGLRRAGSIPASAPPNEGATCSIAKCSIL